MVLFAKHQLYTGNTIGKKSDAPDVCYVPVCDLVLKVILPDVRTLCVFTCVCDTERQQ